MSKIGELMKKLCPNGVEFEELQSVANITIGEFIHKNKQIINGKYPVFNGGITNTGFYDESNNTANKIVISARGANAGYVNKILVDYWAGNSCYSISIKNKDLIDWVFVFYYLKQNQTNLTDEQQKGGIPAVSKKMVEKIKIPIPPLEVQEEIVRILDTFTALISELKAELEARKKQYEYYREKLIIPKEINGKWFLNGKEIEWKKLGDVGEFIRGNGLQKKDFTESGVGCIHYGQIYTYYNTYAYKTKSFVTEELAKRLKKVNKGDLIITNTSENIEDIGKTVAWLGENEIVTGGHATIFKHNQNSKYLAYYTQTKMFFNEKKKYARGTKVIEISTKDLAKIHIPIPTLSEQQRIVEILDKFDTLVNDLSIGIPAEIEARQKQYEYYRNKLLSFKEINNE